MYMLSSKLNLLILNRYTLPLSLISYIVLVGSSNIYLNDTFITSFYSTHKLSENFLLNTTFAPVGYVTFYLISFLNYLRPESFILDIYQCYILITLLLLYCFFYFFINLNEKLNLLTLLLFILSIYIEKSYPFYSTTALIFFTILVLNYIPLSEFRKNQISNKSFFLITITIIFFTRQDLAILALLAFGLYGYFQNKSLFKISLLTFFFIVLFLFFLIFFTNSYDYINLFFNADVNRFSLLDVFYELKILIISPHFIMLLYIIVKNLLFPEKKYFFISKIDLYFFLINLIFLIVDFQTGTREIVFLSGAFNSIYFFDKSSKVTLIFIILIANSFLLQQTANHFFLNFINKDYYTLENTKIPDFKLFKEYKDSLNYINELYLSNYKIVNLSNTRFFDVIYANKNKVFLPIWLDDNVTFYNHHINKVHESIINYDPDYLIIQDTNNSKKNDCTFENINEVKHICKNSNYFKLINLFRNNFEISKVYDMKIINNIYILNKNYD